MTDHSTPEAHGPYVEVVGGPQDGAQFELVQASEQALTITISKAGELRMMAAPDVDVPATLRQLLALVELYPDGGHGDFSDFSGDPQ